jgi:putative iron-only hydrogenase system regulator
LKPEDFMRIAIVAIFVEDKNCINKVNDILHQYGKYIIGRMGLPNVEEGLNIITLVVKASQEEISALSGKLGSLSGVISKVTYASKR